MTFVLSNNFTDLNNFQLFRQKWGKNCFLGLANWGWLWGLVLGLLTSSTCTQAQYSKIISDGICQKRKFTFMVVSVCSFFVDAGKFASSEDGATKGSSLTWFSPVDFKSAFCSAFAFLSEGKLLSSVKIVRFKIF